MSMLPYCTCPTFGAFSAFGVFWQFAAVAAFALLLLCFENRAFIVHMTIVNVDPTCA